MKKRKNNKNKFGSFYSMSPTRKDNIFLPNPGGPISIGRFNNSIGDTSGIGTSGGSMATSGGMGESLEEVLDDRVVYNLKLDLAKVCHIPAGSIYLDRNGNFQITNISEQDAYIIKNRLQQDSRISNISITDGKYDFSHFNYMMQPKQQKNISARITESEELDEAGELLKGIAGAAKNLAKGALTAKKEELGLKGAVGKIVLSSYKDKRPLLFIFDEKGSLNNKKIEDWIHIVRPSTKVYFGLREIFQSTPGIKSFDNLIKSSNLKINGISVQNEQNVAEAFASGYNKVLLGLEKQKAGYAKEFRKVLESNGLKLEVYQRLFEPIYDNAGNGALADIYIYISLLDSKSNDTDTKALTQYLKPLAEAAMAKNEKWFNNLGSDQKQFILNKLSGNGAQQAMSSKEASTNNLNPEILQNIKSKKYFIFIVKENEYKTLQSVKNDSCKTLLEQCQVVNLNQDLTKELEKDNEGNVVLPGNTADSVNKTTTVDDPGSTNITDSLSRYEFSDTRSLKEEYNMNSEIKQLLKDFCDTYGYDLRTDYSGRFMYGDTCYGVVGPKTVDYDLQDWLEDNGYQDHRNFMKSARWDNMGLDYIMYWPQVPGDTYTSDDNNYQLEEDYYNYSGWDVRDDLQNYTVVIDFDSIYGIDSEEPVKDSYSYEIVSAIDESDAEQQVQQRLPADSRIAGIHLSTEDELEYYYSNPNDFDYDSEVDL